MEAFEYSSLDSQGKSRKGVIQADNEKQARQLLRAQDLVPVQIDKVLISNNKEQKTSVQRLRLKSNELPLLIRQLATLVKAGLPIDDALKTLIEQSDHRNTEKILSTLHAKIMEGQPLATAMRLFPKAFDELITTSIEAGEQSGHLEQILGQLADYLETRDQMGKQSLMALIYPIILILTSIAVVTGMMVYIVPKVTQVFANSQVELPAMTQTLIAISDFLTQYGLWVLIGMTALSAGFWALLQKPDFKIKWHRMVLKWPGIGSLIRTSQAAKFTRTLGILSKSAVPIVPALSLSSQVVSNASFKKACEETAAAVREGAGLAKAMGNAKEFPPLTVKLVHAGEQSGNLSEMLERAAEVQEKNVENKLSTLIGAIQPLAILFVGMIVLFIVLAMLLPIFQLNSVLQ
ncbi:type II secretion system inner membrane protein GspF [Marinicella rhabdoformis]|uniref:type II secretion system inner membrane protein GspF n=1 Tax=Marinicella rhabdoformis TaxID=2580566 RepID=UPI0012AEC472|nr:type II secretion system inner membrane protein GspF [Marinicella rhabdoformis]